MALTVTLKNNTRSVSKIGTLAKIDTSRTDSFLLLSANETSFLGVVSQQRAYREPTEIITEGECLVYVNDNVIKGSVIRAAKSTDRASQGTCKIARESDVPYLRVGTALENGRGMVRVSLNPAYINTTSTGDFQPLDTDLTRLADHRRIGGDSNYSEFEADGTLTFAGDATVWDDIRIVPNIFDIPGGTDPDVISYQPAGSGATFKVYAFAKGDEGFFTIQMPHSYKEGSTMYAHVHWTPGPRGVAESGHVVQWRLDYSFAAIGSNFPAASTVPLADTCDGTNHKHQMTAEAAISGVGLGISSQMWGKIYRWNDASDTWVGTGNNLPIFIEFDIHFEQDTCGSRTKSSK
jgi:hypothetical protein